MTKKLISIVLAVCMVFSCFTVLGLTASAAEGAQTVDDGIYLMGSMNNWTEKAEYKFTANSASSGEYMLDTTLAANDEIKVKKVAGSNATWYPAENYKVDASHAGNVTIYFKETYDDTWKDFGGYFYIQVKSEQQETTKAQETTAAKVVHVDVTAPGLSGAWRIWTWNDNEDGVWTRLAYGAATVRDNFVMAHFANADDADDWKYIDCQTTDAVAVDGASYKILNEKVNEDNKEKYKLVNVSEETTTATGTTEAQETTSAPSVGDGIYLMGSMNNWTEKAEYKFTANSASSGEYMLDTTLAANDEIKVKKVAGSNATWYPAENYKVDASHAGNVTIYFKETYDDTWKDFGGYFYIQVKSEQQETTKAQETTAAPSVGDGIYLMGSMNNWTEKAEYKFTANSASSGEYMLDTTLAANDEIKVKKVAGSNATWYPAENYKVDASHAGNVTIYFKETYDDTWKDFGGYFYIQVNSEQQETTGGDTSTDYYLAGDMNQWSVNAAYKFTANPAAAGEYVLNNVSLTTGQKFKVVKAEGTEIVAYYPDGVNNDYVVTTDIAGTADIYFRPATNDEWKSGFDKAGYIWVAKQQSEEIEVPDAPEGYVNVFLTDTVGWGNVYAYSWDKNGTPTTSWDNAPKMTFVKNDTNGKPVYYVAVPNNCDGIVFNNRTDKTVDATPVSAGAHWKIGSFKQNGDHGEKVYNLEFVEDAGGYAYYLTGSMNTPANVTTWTDAYKFTEGADGNFTLETTLAENNWLKVVRVNLDANNKPTKIAVWYPASNGSDNQDYVVPAALAGNVKITFNPAGNKWNSFHAGGFFTIEKTAAPSPVKIDNFKAYIVNMVFGESLSMKFYVKSAVLDGYTDAYMVFTREGKQTIAQMEGPDSDGDYYFTFKSLYPQLVVDDINAELHAFKNGVEYYGDIYTDSGERYIKRCLEKYKSGSTLKYRNARTMYVDMAIYCGLMQKKMHHKDTTHLITDYLTEEQLSWASTSVETKNDRVFDYKKCENADTQWTASNIVFSDVVVTKAYFKTNSIAGKTVKVTFDGRESTYTEADFIHDSSCDANEYYIEFGDLFARQMSTLCYFTVYNASGTACSPTMQYSIDSYANIIHNHPKYQGQEIDLICQAMVKYGHSVYKYLHNVE